MAERDDAPSPMAAAVAVFTEHGFDAATVDQIAEAAGISRSTFFRRYGSKEDVIFADHDSLLARLAEELEHSEDDALDAIVRSAVAVFDHHVRLGAVARARYRLLRAVPALRDREVVTTRRYETLFARHVSAHDPDGDADVSEACATSVVAVHNRALRAWMEGDDSVTRVAVGERLAAIAGRFRDRPASPRASRVVVVGWESDAPYDEVVDRVTRALQQGPTSRD